VTPTRNSLSTLAEGKKREEEETKEQYGVVVRKEACIPVHIR
jgi:hypothetical protein